MNIFKKIAKFFKTTGLFVVSGCPRSGTSLMMDIHREMYGEDRIMGNKFPKEHRKEALDQMNEIQRYLYDKEQIFANKAQPDKDRMLDMNPNGFWECIFTVGGLVYDQSIRWVFNLLENDWRIAKIVSQGLRRSEPKYLNRVIFMLRHPRSVAKSQEKLKRSLSVYIKGEQYDPWEEAIKHSPDMFINVTMQAMNFFLKNKDIPYLIVEFEELQENPKKVIDEVYEFNKLKGNKEAAYNLVDPKLNRSKHEDVRNRLWEESEYLYEAMLKFKVTGDYEILTAALEYMSDPRREYHKDKVEWKCFRAKRKVKHYDCVMCMEHMETRLNFKARSEQLDKEAIAALPWTDEPCPFECGMNVDLEDEDCLSIEESVDMNFWELDEPHTVGESA